ncbi:bifunctional nuclease family protein [Corynebacterium sp. H130]|uniref:bifunctional nuclease family protein n=1 Tax=Corynebacterium sp. H130 TaxID=3133444 RepID=UPI0030B45EDE
MGFVAVDYYGVTPIGPEMFPCVLLRWAERGRVLPIWVTASSADELDVRDAGLTPRRPTSHDLLVSAYEGLGGVQEIRIVSHYRGVFIASLVLGSGEEVDARASDAMIIARIADIPILVDEDILNESTLFVSAPDLARYFDIVVDDIPEQSESASGDDQADADFEELMRSLGVSEDDLRGRD